MNETRTKVTPACATCRTFGVSYHGRGADSARSQHGRKSGTEPNRRVMRLAEGVSIHQVNSAREVAREARERHRTDADERRGSD
jgi:hypothetical protein